MIDKTHKSDMKDTKAQSGSATFMAGPGCQMPEGETTWITHIEPLQLDKKLCFECQTVKSLKVKVKVLTRVIIKLNQEIAPRGVVLEKIWEIKEALKEALGDG